MGACRRGLKFAPPARSRLAATLRPTRIAPAAGVAKSVDARDLKSLGAKVLCRFESGRPHQFLYFNCNSSLVRNVQEPSCGICKASIPGWPIHRNLNDCDNHIATFCAVTFDEIVSGRAPKFDAFIAPVTWWPLD